MTAQHENLENLVDALPFASLSDWLVAPVPQWRQKKVKALVAHLTAE